MNRREFFIPTAAGALASAHGASLLQNASAFAQATRSMSGVTVLIIRHAEKPDRGWPGPGLTANGEKDKKSLVIRGWQRAGAWATLFGAGIDASGTYPAPARIYAADPADAEEGRPSQRPFETIKALADRLKLSPITHWGYGDEGKLVIDIASFTGVALVCWEHKAITSSCRIKAKWRGSFAICGRAFGFLHREFAHLGCSLRMLPSTRHPLGISALLGHRYPTSWTEHELRG